MRGGKLNEENSLKEEINSTIAARVMAGMPKRNENLAATKKVEITTMSGCSSNK